MTIAVTWQNNPSVAQGLTFYAPLTTSTAPAYAGGSYTPTFTRATTATRVNSSGLIELVGSGEARFDYDPVTLSAKGYLAEGARTNLCKGSELISDVTYWTPFTASVSADTVVAPDGATTADSIVEDTTTAVHGVRTANTASSISTAYTGSVFLKQGTQRYATLLLWGATSTTNLELFTVDLSNGAITTAGTVPANVSVETFPNGWYRLRVTGTTTGTDVNVNLYIYLSDNGANSPSYLGTSKTIYVWGGQIEAGAFASSYIPTTTVAVTRNADVLTYAFAGNADATAGAAYAEVKNLTGSTATTSYDVVFGAGAIGPLWHTSSTQESSSDGTTTVTKTGVSDTTTGIRKRAASWGSTGQSVTGNGLAPATGVFDGAHSNTAIAIMTRTDGAASSFGTIRNVRIYNRQLSDTQLQALTA